MTSVELQDEQEVSVHTATLYAGPRDLPDKINVTIKFSSAWQYFSPVSILSYAFASHIDETLIKADQSRGTVFLQVYGMPCPLHGNMLSSSSSAFALPHTRPSPTWPSPVHIPSPRRIPFASLRRSLLPHIHPNLPTHATPSYFPSTRHPSLSLFSLTWSYPHPLATVLISPGLQWHSAWFNNLALALRAARINVIALDALSTGRSDRLDGKRGLLYNIDDHVEELEAVVHLLQQNRDENGKVFVLGESSGGLTAAVMAMRESVDVDGYILCAPALRVQKELLPPPPFWR